MKITKQTRGGIEKWTAHCPEGGCDHTSTSTTKSGARSGVKSHDRQVHKPERRRARQKAKAVNSARRKLKTYGANQSKIKDDMTAAEIRQSINAARADFQRAAKAARDDNNPGPVNRSNSMRTKGIPGVPDGQKITGLVYDNNNKRVPWDTIRKYHNVD